MAFLDVKVHPDHKFDWDDISVGNTELDHSQNFFSMKHQEHEVELLQKQLSKSEINDADENKTFVDDKAKCTSLVDKQNEEAIKENQEDNMQAKQDPCRRVVTNLACEWSTKKTLTSKGAISKSMPPPPHAYLVKDIYQRNREEAERRRAEEDRKLREFHSRPVPNFNHHHQRLQKRGIVHAVTVPVTPQVLKKYHEAEEKRRKRLQEWRQKNQPPKFESRPPTVLKQKPFVPEKNPVMVQQCPFNLQMDKRLKERKQYDEMKQKALEEKQKQVEIEEEERNRREKERIKELRKAATFKARPNPFKN